MAISANKLKMLKQDDRVLAYLRNNKSGLTTLNSFDKIGVVRLSGSVERLRGDRLIPIKNRRVVVKNKFGEKVRIANYYIEQ